MGRAAMAEAPAYEFDNGSAPAARGSQGTVYFATRSDGLKVAVKAAVPGPLARRALDTEISVLQTLGDLDLSGVMSCLDVIQHDGGRALVMPRYPRHLGHWLELRLRRPGPETLREALNITSQLARILARVHRVPFQGGTIVHRDIKPENVFVAADGSLVLGDFGCAMAIDGLKAVELALYGTPMWAPLDQILPGRTIPDPTWDTYALCVLLYASLTGARPAYQADPRELLSQRGKDVWEAARAALAASPEERASHAKRFAAMRIGSQASELIHVTGRAALVSTDRDALDEGITHLADLAGLSTRRVRSLRRGVWTLLVRGLSPLSHPSPPNRFRDGNELADLLQELTSFTRPSRRTSRPPKSPPFLAGPMGQGQVEMAPLNLTDVPPSALRPGPGPAWLTAGIAAAGLAAFVYSGSLPRQVEDWLDASLFLPDETISLPGGDVSVGTQVIAVAPVRLDRTEVTAAIWAECVSDKTCTSMDAMTSGNQPIIGLSASEAQALCLWRGGRLPTEGEWLLAVGDGVFPWGDEAPTCDHAVALGCEATAPSQIDTTPLGHSPYGLVDLAGNAWEWVEAGPEAFVLLGGAVSSGIDELGRRGRQTPNLGDAPRLAGVRCAYDE